MRQTAEPPTPSDFAHRAPRWSQVLTKPLARVVPVAWRPGVLIGIKGLHTALFVSIGAAIVVFVWDGVRANPGRRAATAAGVALAEAALYISNNQVCPLTPLAEELGDDHGAVVDMFLPQWASRRIPLVSSTAVLAGTVLHLRAAFTRRKR